MRKSMQTSTRGELTGNIDRTKETQLARRKAEIRDSFSFDTHSLAKKSKPSFKFVYAIKFWEMANLIIKGLIFRTDLENAVCWNCLEN